MTYFAIALVALIALLALMLYRQQLSHQVALRMQEREARAERDEILAASALERRSLLDRIQHPAYHQPTEPILFPEPHTPRDLAELGFLGQEVPDGYHVGHGDRELMGDDAAS